MQNTIIDLVNLGRLEIQAGGPGSGRRSGGGSGKGAFIVSMGSHQKLLDKGFKFKGSKLNSDGKDQSIYQHSRFGTVKVERGYWSHGKTQGNASTLSDHLGNLGSKEKGRY